MLSSGRDENVSKNARRQRRRPTSTSRTAQSGRRRPVEKVSGRRRPVVKHQDEDGRRSTVDVSGLTFSSRPSNDQNAQGQKNKKLAIFGDHLN